jgi:superfamily II DNA helicase RecQ
MIIEEYLNEILPSKERPLVSLQPAQENHCFFFRLPALFRSLFTNRLSIVITPLKALMEDQAKDLWKGFINNGIY